MLMEERNFLNPQYHHHGSDTTCNCLFRVSLYAYAIIISCRSFFRRRNLEVRKESEPGDLSSFVCPCHCLGYLLPIHVNKIPRQHEEVQPHQHYRHFYRTPTITVVVVVPTLSPQRAIHAISNVHGANSADALACAMCSVWRSAESPWLCAQSNTPGPS